MLPDHALAEPDLAKLVVEEDRGEERERRDGEVSRRDLPGAEADVQGGDVEEDGDEGGLEENSEVTHGVDHKLLGEGKVSGLADHKVGPLDAHDGDEVTGLGVLESFGGVADWMVVNDMGELVEIWVASCRFFWIPSAFGPLIPFSD